MEMQALSKQMDKESQHFFVKKWSFIQTYTYEQIKNNHG